MIDIIFSQLLVNQDYFGRVWPYLNEDYFEKGPPRTIFNSIKHHVDAYNGIPSKVALNLAISNSNLEEKAMQATVDFLKSLSDEKESIDWLLAETEDYVKKTAVYNATSLIIQIQTNADLPADKRDKRIPDVGAIPDIMRDAIAIGFDTSVGHDWMEDYELRWESYKNKASKIPFKLDILNRITKGGAEIATLNILMAGSNVGKSLGLCSLAADYLQVGKNVLYISMEMSEEVCAKRIDANLLDVSLDDIDDGKITYEEYKDKMERWRESNVLGKLKIKQYATGGANANTFRNLVNELKLKKGFVPDVIIVDYLGICASCRIKAYTENSYTLVKAIAEELRALAFDTKTCIWSACQTTRSGWGSSDMSLGDVAESAGLVHTADFMLGVIETDELIAQGKQLIKQLKSRYGDKNINAMFALTVKKGNQRWMDELNPQPPKIPAKRDEGFGYTKAPSTPDVGNVSTVKPRPVITPDDVVLKADTPIAKVVAKITVSERELENFADEFIM